MGMYTEVLVKCNLLPDLPPEVTSALEFMFNGGDEPPALPEHDFFKKPRWSFVGKGSSYYHIPWPDSRLSGGYLFSRSDLKNYDQEIENFFNWIMPYVSAENGKCIGYSWCEEDDTPALVLFENKS